MKDEEKQTKEIETIIKSNLAEGSFASAFAKKVAIQIAEHYQPKLPEDSVVLSREEWEKLLKIKEEASIKEINYFSNLHKLQKELEQIEKERDSAIDNCDIKSRETAEKIYYGIAWRYYDKEMLDILREYLAKEFNVEIKE